MTRAEAVTVVSKLAGLTDGLTLADESAFSDVSDSDWYARNVKYLEGLGVLDFYGDSFSAYNGITRGEFVKLISGFVPKNDLEAPTFSDVSESHPFYGEIILAAKAGLVNGYPDGTFMPDRTLTRAEIVTVLGRLAKRTAGPGAMKVQRFNDIQGHWAAPQIIAASTEERSEGMLIWYTGDSYGENTAVDKAAADLSLTGELLKNVDATDGDEVEAAVMEKRDERISEIRSTDTDVSVTGATYYVSADGDDSNDGLSPDTPWKTLGKVSSYSSFAAGDGVFFRRGDIFRGQLLTKNGVTYSAYGEGDKPRIYGSARNYAGSDFWKKTDVENVWVSSEEFAKDVGLIVFDEGKAWTYKKVDGIGDFDGTLRSDLEMYHSKQDKRVYLYSVSDPNTRYSSCEIAPGQHGITGTGYNVVLDNLCVKYVGAHGVFYGDKTRGLTVKNCEFGWIGGMIQMADGTRYGNAVEIYVSCYDYTVDNCYIYECYDAGVTHQWYARKDERVEMENIRYTNNVIERCSYNIEYINKNLEEDGVMKNVTISGNLLLDGGEGWGNQRPVRGDAVIMGGNSINYSENFRIFDNVIHTKNDKCDLVRFGVQRAASLPAVFGNIFVGVNGHTFGMHGLMNSDKHIYNERLNDCTVGLEDNTMIFLD